MFPVQLRSTDSRSVVLPAVLCRIPFSYSLAPVQGVGSGARPVRCPGRALGRMLGVKTHIYTIGERVSDVLD